MIDYKERKPCGRKQKKDLTLTDFLVTFLMIVAVLSLFAAASWELAKEGGALDHALGLTAQDIQKK